MAFGYAFVDLNDEQKHARRELLDWYPLVAQFSVLFVLAAFQLCFLLSWLAHYGIEYERPRSPSFNKRIDGKWTWLRKSRQGFQKLVWWMKTPVIANWGTRGEWIGGAAWTLWLLYLCVVQTGNDYLHLTKRFGAIGGSQLPLHYLLAMRAPYSPIQWLTRLSHEELKSSHQILGRIVFVLFVLHAIFYMNFFVLSGFLAKRIKDTDVIFGIISLILFSIISTTALGKIRRWNYRVFYLSHIAISFIIVVPLYIHVHHIRLYVWEVVAVNGLHLITRAVRSRTYMSSVRLLPGTNLVEIRIPLTTMASALAWKPGQHVYLRRTDGISYPASIFDWRTNPFTVASIPVKDKELLLVARTLKGNTKGLADLAKSLRSAGSDEAPRIPMALEGPYGASSYLPDFSLFDRVLLVAGGVGATFVMPVYRSIVEFHNPDHAGGPQIRCIWAVQKLAETQWAFPAHDKEEEEDADVGAGADAGAQSPLYNPSTVEVFVTRPSGPSLQVGEAGEDVELAEDDQLLSMEEQMEKPRKGMTVKSGRPKISAIVEEVFSKGTSVAVVSCGPKPLTDQVRRSVAAWIAQGHDVYWHDETFGW
ncbi:hypothetical protein BS50DRAFT_522965 [Corynespora cassiicola Philippines]|uniref:FAD-binding FR-type domain-containing protein n=1 Tax=Corynespora cassiicola Philippines TaxID=1448308 RepID=A0A2T2NRI4_CORCC|nr:hypothetical protein BS50DRAFT_522965 [Corynespora cassiicola Philippines]